MDAVKGELLDVWWMGFEVGWLRSECAQSP